MEHAPTFRLIVGLGNPGRQYANTRHNVGFLVLDELQRREAAEPFQYAPKWNAEITSWREVVLMKPQTFMNRSGESVGSHLRYHQIEPAQILVVLDDAALPFGDLRLRSSGSAGGHNGLESILHHLGSDAVPRLRVGIGAASGALDKHVLGQFSSEENAALPAAMDRAADAVAHAESKGLPAAMNLYNQKTIL